MPGNTLTAAAVKDRAREVGFDLCGIATAARHPRLERLTSWIDRGYAGEMAYLRKSRDERLDPRRVLPTARSVVSLACLYNTADPYSTAVTEPGRAVIARYAWGDDYHDVLRARLTELVRWMDEASGGGIEAFSCVDNGPVQERVFAEQAGLGWIGKNTCLISPTLGSWLFLAEVLTSAELEPDRAGVDQCGTCTRCLDACPTGAITEPYVVDATRCVSYLTIETRGAVEASLRSAMSREIVGCDICQDVCTWNRRRVASADPAWQPRDAVRFPSLVDLCQRSDDDWRRDLKGSALRRAGLRRIRRTLAYAAAQLPPADGSLALDALAAHPSAADEIVSDAISWARRTIASMRQG